MYFNILTMNILYFFLLAYNGCIYVHMCVCMYICVYMCVYVYIFNMLIVILFGLY